MDSPQWSFPTDSSPPIFGAVRSPDGRRVVVITNDGRGIDPSTGRVAWLPPSAIGYAPWTLPPAVAHLRAIGAFIDRTSVAAVVPVRPEWAPILVTASEIETVARSMIPVPGAEGLSSVSIGRAAAHVGREPQSAVPLPWWVDQKRLEDWTSLGMFAIVASAIGVVGPWLLIRVTRRRFGWRLIGMMAVVAAIALVFTANRLLTDWLAESTGDDAPPEFRLLREILGNASLGEKWEAPMLLLIGLPPLVLAATCIRWLGGGKLGRLFLIAGAIGVISFAIGQVWILKSTMLPGTWRAWDRWWLLPLGVAYGLGLAAIPVGVLTSAVQGVRRVVTARHKV